MKNYTVPTLVFLFLCFVSFESTKLYFEAQDNYKRMENNFKAAQEDIERFKTKAGENATRITMQEFTIKELKTLIPAAVKEIKALNIRPGELRSITTTTADIHREISTPVRDSVIFHQGTDPQAPAEPGKPDTIKTFKYSDKWFQVKGEIYQDTADLVITGRDTTKTIIYQSRKHRLLWIFSKKEFRAVTVNKNPGIKLTPGQTIMIKL